MTNLASPFGKYPFGRPLLPSSTIDNHLAAMKPEEVIAGLPLPPLERLDLAVVTVQHHRFPQFFISDKSLHPLEMIKSESSFPSLFIYQSTEDSAVDVAATKKFVEGLKRIVDDDKLVVKLEPGDHRFQTMVGLEESWMKEGLVMVTRNWLQ